MQHIEAADLADRINTGEELILLDIREDYETEIAQIPNSLHIRMNEIPERLDDLDPTTKIVVYCHSGVRSLHVTHYLEQAGFSVLNLRGGITEWSRQVDPSVPIY